MAEVNLTALVASLQATKNEIAGLEDNVDTFFIVVMGMICFCEFTLLRLS